VSDDLEGYGDVVEFNGEDYHLAALYESEEAWIDYSCPVNDVPVPQRDDVNVMLGEQSGDLYTTRKRLQGGDSE
jgi:hypothetical protein